MQVSLMGQDHTSGSFRVPHRRFAANFPGLRLSLLANDSPSEPNAANERPHRLMPVIAHSLNAARAITYISSRNFRFGFRLIRSVNPHTLFWRISARSSGPGAKETFDQTLPRPRQCQVSGAAVL